MDLEEAKALIQKIYQLATEYQEPYKEKVFSKLLDVFLISSLSAAKPMAYREEMGTISRSRDEQIKEHFGVVPEDLYKIVDLRDSDFDIVTDQLKRGSNAERQIKLSLIYCLANKFCGRKTTSLEELREQCKNFGCFDPSNFAKYLARHRNWFMTKGKRRSRNKECYLTRPGIDEAKKIIAEFAQSG